MRKRMVLMGALCLLTMMAIIRSAQPATRVITVDSRFSNVADKSSTETELLALEKQWLDAFARGDTETFIRFLADDYCAINDDGSFANRAQVVAMAKASASTLNIEEHLVRVYGQTAVINGRVHGKGKIGGVEREGYFRYTEVWVNRDGRWQVVLWQGTTVAQK